MEFLICVDEEDNEIGSMEKLNVHKLGLLHRAFSVFIFREKKGGLECLLQRRAMSKYHTPGLWSNACCSHPRLKMDIKESAQKRLKEEMGFDCHLSCVGHFMYRAELDNGLVENEYDYIFVGTVDECKIDLNPDEVESSCWMNINELNIDIQNFPKKYTPWFPEAYEIALKGYYELSC